MVRKCFQVAVACVASFGLAGYMWHNQPDVTQADADDSTSFESPAVLARKLYTAALAANHTLSQRDPFVNRPFAAFAAIRAFSNVVQSADLEQLLSRPAGSEASKPTIPSVKQMMELQAAFDLADAAYDLRTTLEPKMHKRGYYLMSHEDGSVPGRVAYYMAFSPASRTAIIGLKGTGTPADVMTDLICRAVPLSRPDGSVAYVHEGMSNAAQAVLHEVFPTLEHLLLPHGYRVLVTGHSLGAGTAALLGLALRDKLNAAPLHQKVGSDGEGWASRVEVLAFATPPVMDVTTALSCQSFVTSVVNRRDVIPRSSLMNLVMLMNALSEVDKRLQETNGDPSTFSLSSKDATALVRRAMDIPGNPKDFLYVPGQVVLMSAEQVGLLRATLTDGTAPSLRCIHFDMAMFSDHLSHGHKTSLAALAGAHAQPETASAEL
ncbi:hypothetical protein CYMTET_9823 [Cymbomonas tetramitiformis]|uniref:sn-1-specific diacylglycerol lipase n=1 Tax=Cymbomonas tetramitiformis TaxID=36881 RepID=A0AAE0LEG7_9CHLO|nr:hypothetical protein CYMTET_9823 [Cymbomonas tetramitiformis]